MHPDQVALHSLQICYTQTHLKASKELLGNQRRQRIELCYASVIFRNVLNYGKTSDFCTGSHLMTQLNWNFSLILCISLLCCILSISFYLWNYNYPASTFFFPIHPIKTKKAYNFCLVIAGYLLYYSWSAILTGFDHFEKIKKTVANKKTRNKSLWTTTHHFVPNFMRNCQSVKKRIFLNAGLQRI